MGIDHIIIIIMTIFMIIGGVDKILGNKFGYGEKFEEGIMAMGALAVAMVGIISLAPVLGNILTPIVGPLYSALGADPSMFATTLLANDMGGAPLALSMANDPQSGLFAAFILGAMLGPTIVFTIPVALGIIEENDKPFLAKGILSGIVTIPLGALAGGIVAGFPIVMIMKNLVPIILVAALIVLGLIFIPDKMTKGFAVFGKGVEIVIVIGLIAAIVEQLTGIVVIHGMAPVTEGLSIVGSIAIVLAGALPLVHFITQVFGKPLQVIGKKLGMNEAGAAGLVATLANNIPMFSMLKDMDENGKVMNIAFAVSAAFVFGDHLGFTAGFDGGKYSAMIFPMIIGKLVAGITAIFVAKMLFGKKKEA